MTDFDVRVSGSGRLDELNRASIESISKCAWCRGSTGILEVSLPPLAVPGFVMTEGGGAFFEGLGEDASGRAPPRAPSDRRFDFGFEVVAAAVCDLAGFELSGAGSTMGSPDGWGLRACATARGPAHEGRMGTAMLASTKLDRTVTGRVFSRIFSWRTVSARPKTMCWTLL